PRVFVHICFGDGGRRKGNAGFRSQRRLVLCRKQQSQNDGYHQWYRILSSRVSPPVFQGKTALFLLTSKEFSQPAAPARAGIKLRLSLLLALRAGESGGMLTTLSALRIGFQVGVITISPPAPWTAFR